MHYIKQIFLLEVEQGGEVFIPRELNQSDYPVSFRFYNFINNFI